MLDWLRTRSPAARTATKLYGSIVTQARTERFYAALATPDDPEGRFEMLLVHLALVLERLGREGAEGFELSRGLIEAFIGDMDDCLREMGVGDLTVPRRVKKAAAALYERRQVYAGALAEPDDAMLVAALARNVYRAAPPGSAATELARDLRRIERLLAGQSREALLAGDVAFA